MELPISKQSYLPSADTFIRAIKRANAIFARTGAEETAIDGAILYSDKNRPQVACVNYASDMQVGPDVAPGAAPSEPQAADIASAQSLLEAITDHFAKQNSRCHWFEATAQQWPPALLRVFHDLGAHDSKWHVLMLDRPGPVVDARVNKEIQIIPARAAYAEARALFLTMANEEHRLAGAPAEQFADAMIDQLDEPRLDMFIGRFNQRPVGVIGVLTLGNLAVLWPAFTPIAGRGKGVAGTLMQHTLEFSRRAQFEQLLIDRHDGCPAIPFYNNFGFKPVATFQRFHPPR
jgi:hypothetical protein